jgi:hypothetical protein
MNSLWDILSVAIGVSFVFLILSLLNSWVQEYVATVFSLRANNLADILQNMLEPDAEKLNGKDRVYTPFSDSSDRAKKLIEKNFILRFLKEKFGGRVEQFTVNAVTRFGSKSITQYGGKGEKVAQKLGINPVRAFYEHPIIYSLSKPSAMPSYVQSSDFTVALFDLLNRAGKEDQSEAEDPTQNKITIENIRKGIEKIERSALKARLKSLLDTAQINKKDNTEVGIEDFRTTVIAWFDATMDRGKGWYKRKTQFIGILCGVVLAILLNADTISLSNALWQNAVLRESVSQAAVVYAEKGDNVNAQTAQQQLLSLGLPIGWSFRFADQNPATTDDPRDFPSALGGWVSKAIGLILTGFAISQGSQIWFDLMNRLINLRSTGLKPEPEEKETTTAE